MNWNDERILWDVLMKKLSLEELNTLKHGVSVVRREFFCYGFMIGVLIGGVAHAFQYFSQFWR